MEGKRRQKDGTGRHTHAHRKNNVASDRNNIQGGVYSTEGPVETSFGFG